MPPKPNSLSGATLQRLVLLDRDGVINEDRAEGILKLEHFTFLPRAAEALSMLTRAGFKTAICTNQSALGRGVLSFHEFDRIHAHMHHELRVMGAHLDRVYVAPDPAEAATNRRKPGPGMLLEALRDFKAEAAQTFFVGDMLRDAQAAHHAGCPFILVRTGKGEKTLSEGIPEPLQPKAICTDLFAAVQFILKDAGIMVAV